MHTYGGPMASLDAGHPVASGRAPIRSVLKRAGHKSKGFRVSINESRNEVVDADYIILLQDQHDPQLVSIKALDFTRLSSSAVDLVTLSPPDGYKDCFGRAIHQSFSQQSENECEETANGAWTYIEHGPDCAKSLAAPLGHVPPDGTPRTGILKGGKYWKGAHHPRQEYDTVDAPRRGVRFSGQDQYDVVECDDSVPLNMSHPAPLTSFLSPQLHDLQALLGDKQDDWHLQLSPVDQEVGQVGQVGQVYHLCPRHGDKQRDDEQISESVQRYEQMRRRIAITECRDEMSDASTAEARIRRLENSDVAQVAGGILRSNNEVRRAIERNALRRSLIRFAEARKKDTNKNDKNAKQESCLIDKLKWLTASEDLTNGNAHKHNQHNQQPCEVDDPVKAESALMVHTIEQYRKLAEMFNKSTSSKDPSLQIEGREWRADEDVEPPEGIAEFGEDLSLTLTYTAVPAVCEPTNDDEVDKLIYSGGVRYTKEGTLPLGMRPFINGMLKAPRRYPVEEIDESAYDERSSSVPSSSQSSPRLSARVENEVVSTTESGYSSNETNSDSHSQPIECDELVDFVRQDTGRIHRIRRKYDDTDDHGFARRPSVRGIKNPFGSPCDILKQMTQPNNTLPFQETTNLRDLPPIEDELAYSSSRCSYVPSMADQTPLDDPMRTGKDIHVYVPVSGQCPTGRNQRLPSAIESPSSETIDHHPSCHSRRALPDTMSNDMLTSAVHNNRTSMGHPLVMDLPLNYPEGSFNSHHSYPDSGLAAPVLSPCGAVCSHHHAHQVSPLQHNPPPPPAATVGPKLAPCDKPTCPGWHTLDSRYSTKVGVSKSMSSTVVSSHMSYTTPIVPDNCHSRLDSSHYSLHHQPPPAMRNSHSMNIST